MSTALHSALLAYAAAIPALDVQSFTDPRSFFAHLERLPLHTLVAYLYSARSNSTDPAYDRLSPLCRLTSPPPFGSTPLVSPIPLPRAIFI